MLIPCDEVNILNTFRVMIILRLLLLLTNLHLKLLSTQGIGADKLLSTQRVNRELKHLCGKKSRKYKKAKRSGKEDHWKQYKEFQKLVQSKLTEEGWDYINRFLQIGLETGSKKLFWKYLRVQKQEDFGISVLKSNGTLFTDRKPISETLNTQLKSVFTKNTSARLLDQIVSQVGSSRTLQGNLLQYYITFLINH